eukprot:11110969-Alexandrium_andersonii.AAC.1
MKPSVARLSDRILNRTSFAKWRLEQGPARVLAQMQLASLGELVAHGGGCRDALGAGALNWHQ